MNTKKIVFSNGTIKLMTFEEVMEANKGLIIRVARRYKGIKLSEDDMQEGYLALWKAFESYNEENCFSTHATWLLRQRFGYLKSMELAAMRNTVNRKFYNLDYDFGDGTTLSEIVPDAHSQFEHTLVESDFIKYIQSNLSEFEMDLLAFNLKHMKSKEIVEKYNTKKQNISNKNARFKIKLRELIEEYNSI